MLAAPARPSGSTSAPVRTSTSAASNGKPGPLRHNHAQTILEPGFFRLDESNLMRRRRRRRLYRPPIADAMNPRRTDATLK